MVLGDLKRWLYRGGRPGWTARFLNRIDATVASIGIAPYGMVTLEVTGRHSGRAVSLPVVVAMVEGQRYLVSMLGKEAQWVLNVRAAKGQAALVSGAREDVLLVEVPSEQRAPLLKAYLRLAPGARPHIPVSKDAPLEAFGKIAADFPVFRITPLSARA